MSKNLDKYYKVIAVENSDSADILLYGYIGQEKWWDDDPIEPLTDLALSQTIKELEQKFDRINIRINSPGGSMFHGNAIITAMQNSTAEIHTYNDGLAASMAGDIWIAGKVRHMAKNSLLMIHAPSTYVRGTAKDLRQEADVLDKFEFTAIAVMAEATGETVESIKQKYYDYEDHWFTAPEVEEMKLITKVEEYEAQEVPKDADKMTLAQMVKYFADKGDAQAKRWVQGLNDYFKNVIGRRKLVAKTIYKSKTSKKMNTIEDIIKACEKGELNLVDLQERLKTVQPTEAPAPAPAPDPKKEATDSGQADDLEATLDQLLTKKLKPLQDENSALKAQLEKLANSPTEGPAKIESTEAPATEESDDYDALKALNATMEQAAKKNEAIKVVGHGSARRPQKA